MVRNENTYICHEIVIAKQATGELAATAVSLAVLTEQIGAAPIDRLAWSYLCHSHMLRRLDLPTRVQVSRITFQVGEPRGTGCTWEALTSLQAGTRSHARL